MVLRTFVASDSAALIVVSSSSAGIVGNPIINNSSTPDGTIFAFTSGFGTTITLDDTSANTNIFDDDAPGSHIITDGGGIVTNGNQVESESIIVVRALDGTGSPTGPNIELYVLSQNGSFGDVWGFSSDTPLVDGTQYIKVSGSNAGGSTYTDFVTCFAHGTLVRTAKARVLVEDLRVGQLVWTRGNGVQPVRWIGHSDTHGTGAFAPVVFEPGAIGNTEILRVSQQHRMWLESHQAEYLFGTREVLVAAKHLVGLPGVSLQPCASMSYCHVMFDRHQVIEAAGALSESFFLSEHALGALDADRHAELVALFPALTGALPDFGATAAMTLTAHEANVLRHAAL